MRLLRVVLLFALAGCSGGGAPAPRYLNPAGSCPGVDAAAERLADRPLPADFVAVSAVLCHSGPPGVPSGAPAARPVARRSTGPFGDLLTALREPPPRAPRGEYACPAMLQAPILLALTDAAGRTVLPAIPATVCGFRVPAVDAAVAALDWT